MEVKVTDMYFGKKTVKLSWFKWFRLKMTGAAYLFHAKLKGWKAELPFYVVKCPQCKQYFLDYPHGHSEYFTCPICDLPKLEMDAT